MAFLKQLLDRLLSAEPQVTADEAISTISPTEPTDLGIQQTRDMTHAVDFNDLLRAMGCDL